MTVTPHSPSDVAGRAAVSPHLVTAPTCPAAVREAYHTLLTNVELALGPDKGRLIAVAALDDTAHATRVAANLALIAAAGGDRTLLVDGDVRSPTLHELFDAAAAPGLAQFLNGTDDAHAVVQLTPNPGLEVVMAGVSGARHAHLDHRGDAVDALRRLSSLADRMIVAIAPVLTSADVLRVGPHVDGVLLALTAGRTRRVEAARATALLQKARVPVVGVVLTP